MNFERQPLSAGLYLVATPIGAARDITLRGLDVLASADVIAAEDTRTARKLMDIHGIPLGDRKLVAFHDHSGMNTVDKLVARMAAGASVAVVSEAGTPLVADPGFELVRAAGEAGLEVHAVPGPSAALAALSVAGLPSDRFAFVGFLPSAQAARLTELADLKDLPFTLIFFESPKRVGEVLGNMCDVFGKERVAVVCRELTKKFETADRGSLADLADRYRDVAVRGEIVIVVGRPTAKTVAEDDVRAALQEALTHMRLKDAATAVAGALGLPRREVYQQALRLKEDE